MAGVFQVRAMLMLMRVLMVVSVMVVMMLSMVDRPRFGLGQFFDEFVDVSIQRQGRVLRFVSFAVEQVRHGLVLVIDVRFQTTDIRVR